jgi:coenzyme PQQ synthesis protein D (PqqD)
MNFTSEKVNEIKARETCLIRNPKILKRQIDDTVFLVNPDDDTIFYLNPLSTGIWNLLAEPTTPSETQRIVQQAFPDVSPDQIAADVSTLIKELEKKDLVLRHG